MYLTSIEYQEHQGTSNYWSVKKLEFGNVNLIVGKNSSGKSRIINIINALAVSLAGRAAPFGSGSWSAEFERQKGLQREPQVYKVEFKDTAIVHESFKVKSNTVMERGASGEGYVASRKGGRVKYQVPRDRLMAVMRSDPYQHPQFEHLKIWSTSLCVYRFGSEFGKGSLTMQNQPSPAGGQQDGLDMAAAVDNASNVFLMTHAKFGFDFEFSVLQDLESIGYPCTYVGMHPIQNINFAGSFPLGLAVKEAGLACLTTQNDMSQGMYRALALIVQVNANILWAQSRKVGRELLPGDSPMIIIDDIGEGLDFDRSKRLIHLLVQKALKYKIQLIMSSNDRFIMNDVPLEYWTVLHREGSVVRPFNYMNSKSVFDEFEYLGLNNFDFFSHEYFKASSQG